MFSVGTTGTGKSTMMRDLLDQVRKRGKKAVVFDLTGTFIEGFYDPTRDVILNPFDERCPQWSIFNDCTTRAEFTSAAEALIPSDGGGAEPFWVQAARLLFVEACVRLSELGLTTNRHLYEELMTASLKEVNALVGGTVASPLSDPQAARMAESIRATMNTNINAIRSLPIEGEQFSIKEWVHAEHEGGSVLFIAARHVDLSTVKVLLTLWMDMTINAMMAGTPSPRDVRIWFLFDELGALHRLPAIEKGMQTARNYGGAFVLGVHTIAKLRDTYGDDIAETLGSLARTKLILATADYTSAKWCSDQIGNGEWSEMEQGYQLWRRQCPRCRNADQQAPARTAGAARRHLEAPRPHRVAGVPSRIPGVQDQAEDPQLAQKGPWFHPTARHQPTAEDARRQATERRRRQRSRDHTRSTTGAETAGSI